MSSTKKEKSKGVVWKQSGIRKIMIYLDAHKGGNSDFINDQRQPLDELYRMLEDDFDDTSYSLLTRAKIRDKYSHIWRDCKSNSDDDIKEFWKNGTSKLDMVKFEEKFCPGSVDAGAGEDSNSNNVPQPTTSGVNRKKRSSSNMGGSCSLGRQQVKTREELEEEITRAILIDNWQEDSDEFPKDGDSITSIIERFASMAAKLSTSTVEKNHNIIYNDLRDDSLNLQGAIKKAVEDYLKAMGFPEKQPIAVDLGIYPSPEFAPLLVLLVGTTGERWDETRLLLEHMFASQTQDKLSLNILVQGLVGAAVHKWVFNFKQPANTTLEMMKEMIEPKFPGHAKKLAVLFDQQLGHILPNRRGTAEITDPATIFNAETQKAAAPDVKTQGSFWRAKPLPLTAKPRRPIITMDWQVKWLNALVGIFGMALHIRSNLAKVKDAEYQFEFPAWMDPYGQENNNDRVLMGLLPTVKVLAEDRVKNGEETMVSMKWGVLCEGLHHGAVVE